jgi:hypothetical protein
MVGGPRRRGDPRLEHPGPVDLAAAGSLTATFLVGGLHWLLAERQTV